MGLDKLKRGLLIQFKRYVDQLTGSSGYLGALFVYRFSMASITVRNSKKGKVR